MTISIQKPFELRFTGKPTGTQDYLLVWYSKTGDVMRCWREGAAVDATLSSDENSASI